LADAGTGMLKVEPPEGDPRRHRPPFAGARPGPQSSLSFAVYRTDQRGVVLDYRLPEAAAALADLGATPTCSC
jgi:crotonobetainyl-CoA:carnitine CoA-transferase CaiB-like acyl-CoA transferase